jgi:ribosome-binding protein aMBF1 (putative translation factor)
LREAEKLDKEARTLKKELLKMCWYMRGLSYSELANMSFEERSIINDIIKENLDTTKKTKLPFF